MFRGKKTTTFYVGLVALGFGLSSLCYVLFALISTVFTIFSTGRIYTSLISFLPQICNVVIFFAIGLYVMSKGVEKQPTSNTENSQ